MTTDWREQVARVLTPALARSASIAEIEVGEGALAAGPALYARCFAAGPACLVADDNTWAAGGARLADALATAGVAVETTVLAGAPRLKPTRELGDCLARAIPRGATPVAVGSGVINDVVKYAAHALGRPYLSVTTAASMDGYASAGAPLVDEGFKKTVPCRPPRAILADLDVIRAAPRAMAAWGYDDLAGKMPAGGDWLIADALDIEPIDAVAWPLVQDNLRGWLAGARHIAEAEAAALAGLFVGLAVAGLAMELHGSSRPASGLDHQIAHVWEMQDLTHGGERVAHGACVAIGCLSALALFDWLVAQDLTGLDPARIAAAAPDMAAKAAAIAAAFPDPAIAARAGAETAAKHLDPAAHRRRIEAVRATWPGLRERVEWHLMRAPEMRALLGAAGAPVHPAEIGVDPASHRATVAASRFIRSRYTVLDLIDECGLLDQALDAVFPLTA
jgi:glycerol-1-phosphate dehydrogenase [NAD(P)+]